MGDRVQELVSEIRSQIEKNNLTIGKINHMKTEIEEAHFRELKRIESYVNSDSLSFADRQNYLDKRNKENKDFMELNDEYESAIRKINRENEEKEEEIRELYRQQEEKEDEEEEEQ